MKSQPEQHSIKAENTIVGKLTDGMGDSGSNNKEGNYVKYCPAVLWTDTTHVSVSWAS